MATGSGSPCGACKFLRRKCTSDCVFAPYFCTEQGPARFAAIHKVFGASNVSKLLLHIPVPDRCEAVVTIGYEAQARIKDPVYGCVSHIIALQQQVAFLEGQVMQVKAQLAQSSHHQWPGITQLHHHQAYPPTYMNTTVVTPQSLLDSIDNKNYSVHMQDMQQQRGEFNFKNYSNKMKRPSQTDLGELQALALRMMND